MFDVLAEPISTPRGELVTYASRSATRWSSDGAAEGDEVWPNSGDTNAMIPVSNKTRSITRVRYRHASSWRQENTVTILTAATLQCEPTSTCSFAARLCQPPTSKRDWLRHHLAGRRLKRNLLRYFNGLIVVIIILIICVVRIGFVRVLCVGSRPDCGQVIFL
jgi:hypothetical protein